MSRALPKPGNYPARRTRQMVVQSSEKGALGVDIQYQLLNSDVNFTGVHTVWIGARDGNLLTKSIDVLKQAFPTWNGQNPFDLEEIPLSEDESAPEFELGDCYHDDSWTPPGESEAVVQFKARWFNPVGGMSKMSEPLAADDRKAVLAKWASKFKAVSKPVAPAKAAPVEKVVEKTSSTPSRKVPGRVAAKEYKTIDEVWNACEKKHKGEKNTDEIAEIWNEANDKLFGNPNQAETPEQFTKLAAELGV